MMKNNFKVTIPLAIVITMIAVLYQRATGPTYPKRFKIPYAQGQILKLKFPRSQGGGATAPVEISKFSGDLTAVMHFKRYPTSDAWTEAPFQDLGNQLKFELPNQPPAAKLSYFVVLQWAGQTKYLGTQEEPILIRFKGDVPVYILAPHVFFMFLSMLFSALAFFEALYNTESFVKIARITLGCLMFGGMFLGPLVQKYAFGVYWAGFPYDWDLTDNKLLIGVLAWLFGVGLTLTAKRRWPVLLAAAILIGVYSIPHSMRGSQFNFEKGKVETLRK